MSGMSARSLLSPLPHAGEGGAKRRVRALADVPPTLAPVRALTLARFARISLPRTRGRGVTT